MLVVVEARGRGGCAQEKGKTNPSPVFADGGAGVRSISANDGKKKNSFFFCCEFSGDYLSVKP